MEGTFTGDKVCIGKGGDDLHEQSGYGRRDAGSVQLAPEEALYLLQRGKIAVPGYNFEELLRVCSQDTGFLRRFLVYRDIRERGYVIQPGLKGFRIFRRGEKPGTGRSQYIVRVLSERDPVAFRDIAAGVTEAGNMRKQYLLAVVDDEDELTYYEVKTTTLPEVGPKVACERFEGSLFGTTVILSGKQSPLPEGTWIGTMLDSERLMLSSTEALYLLKNDFLMVDEGKMDVESLRALLSGADEELNEKLRVYENLRDLGYIARTAYKFGHHFRVYSGQKKHSEMLVHAVRENSSCPMSEISRSVRLAHSVRKKMLFAYEDENVIEYIEFARIKL